MPTRITAHYLGGTPDPRAFVIPAQASAVVLVDAFGTAAQFTAVPNLFVLGRMTNDGLSGLDTLVSQPPTVMAAWYVGRLAQAIFDNPAIPYWQIGNEQTVNEPFVMRWWGEFSAECARLIRTQFNKGAALLNVSDANPNDPTMLQHAPMLFQAVRDYGGVVGLHRYMNLHRLANGEPDINRTVLDPFHFGRIPLDYEIIKGMGYGDLNLIINETGLERLKPSSVPFLESGLSDAQYAAILNRAAAYLETLPYVIGAAVFTVGSGGGFWPHDIANTRVLDLHAEWAKQNKPAPPPPAVGPLVGKVCRVQAGGLNYRAAPGGEWLGFLAEGTRVRVIEQAPQWARIKPDGWLYTASNRLLAE